MNGVCCRRLLDESGVIFDKIKQLVRDKIMERTDGNDEKITQLTKVIDTFCSLFDYIDRILDPTLAEMEEINVSIKGLELLWNELDLSITPKMHILLEHTVG